MVKPVKMVALDAIDPVDFLFSRRFRGIHHIPSHLQCGYQAVYLPRKKVNERMEYCPMQVFGSNQKAHF
jgi:hypothetical protein